MSTALVVPCFNEEHRLDSENWKLVAALSGIQLIFVNDGSTDGTEKVLREICDESGARYVHLPSNLGKAEAVRLGMLSVFLDSEPHTFVGFIDSDGAFSSTEIERMTAVCLQRTSPPPKKNFDCVWSSRIVLAGRMVKRTKTRYYLGRIVALLVTSGISDCPYDTQSGFKIWVMSTELRQTIQQPFETRWLFEIEIMKRWQNIHHRKLRIWEEPLEFWQDVSGSKIGIKESFRIIEEIIKIRRLSR